MHVSVFSLKWMACTLTKLKTLSIEEKTLITPKYYIISEIVHWQRAKMRLGCANALTKGEVSGTGKKPFAQKGRGMARQGTLKNPHQKGGGVAFPPKNRKYIYKINRKKKHVALQSMFIIRLQENRIRIFENILISKPSTKIANILFKKIFVKKTLLIDNKNLNLKLSIRNLPKMKFVEFKGLNTVDMLKYVSFIITKNVFDRLLLFFNIKYRVLHE